ncbi:MAG: pitrilysin family protein [Verrucomicrobiota bacterium]
MSATTSTYQFDNKLRLAVVEMPHMASTALGIWNGVGSRHETDNQHGMAHFMEHLVFKGSPLRNAAVVSREIEGLGASIDGFTVEDYVSYQVKGPSECFPNLLEVLADIYRYPVLDPAEIEAERQVIGEEIAMVRDQPAQWLEDLLSEAVFGETHPLGRSITGTHDSLSAMTRSDLTDFHRASYSGGQTVIAVAGPIKSETIVEQVGLAFEGLSCGAPIPFKPATHLESLLRFEAEPSQEQAHLALSFPSVDRHDPTRYAHKLLSVILGENMSSRLFQIMREKHALCYEIQSDLMSFEDVGAFQIFLALSPDRLELALQVLGEILNQIASAPVSATELETAKRFIIGQSRISLENTGAQVMWAGEGMITFGDWVEPEEIHAKLAAVTVEEIQAAAVEVLTRKAPCAALIGPEESHHILAGYLSATY